MRKSETRTGIDEPLAQLKPTARKSSRLTPAQLTKVGQNFARLRNRRVAELSDTIGTRTQTARALLAATVALAIGAVGLGGEASARHPATCGQGYVVERGDTLFKIAERVYGDGWLYRKVFRANRDILPTEAAIEIGDELFLPCFDGSGPETRIDAIALGLIKSAIPEPDTTTVEASADASETEETVTSISALSAPEVGRFAGEQLTNGGMMTDMLTRALENAAPGIGLNAGFVEDRSAHLDLLAQGAFQIGYPWVRPDCDDGSLDPDARRLCDEFTFSAPILETSVSFFVRLKEAQDPPRTRSELAGRRICRTEGGLSISLILPGVAADEQVRSADQCFGDLMRGLVDAVAIKRHEALEVITLFGVENYVAEARDLAASQTLHAIAPSGNADAMAALALIDQGTGALMASGVWFEIIVAHQRHQLAQVN